MNIKQQIVALSLGLSLLTNSAFATDIALITGGSIANASTNLTNITGSGALTPFDGADTLTGLNYATFNAMSVASLLATYDTIVMPWNIPSTMNADWNTRLLPYLNGGGRILWEDPNNIGDLAASGINLTSSTSIYPGIGEGQISLVAPFGDAGASGFYHIHYGILGAASNWDVWSTDVNGGIHGVYAEFDNGGRMVLGVSDNLYHPNFNFVGDSDHRALTLNQLNWLNTGSVTGSVPDSGTSVMLLGLGLGALALARRRVAA